MKWISSKTIGGVLLVGGTAIGAGMLALPVVTGEGGFIPAIVVFLICWLVSTCTGLLFLEICLWMPAGANIITMAQHFFGPIGKVCACLLYIFLFYCLSIAYVAGGGGFVVALFQGKLSHLIGTILFSLIFGMCVYMGTRVVNLMNFLLMIGLWLSYAVFVGVGMCEVRVDLLLRRNWGVAILAFPVIFTSFSFQGIIPSLVTYLDRNPKMIRFAIVMGSLLPLVGYILWEYLVLGLVPVEGVHGLMRAKILERTALESLRAIFPHLPIYIIGQFFSFFALTTSFLGVTLALLDFLSDGLQMPAVEWRRVVLCLLIYAPPIVVVGIDPNIFITMLGYAGGIGCALLLGLLPIIMVWVGRYNKHYPPSSGWRLPGGRILLTILGAVILVELLLEFV